ncbi:hypothetical protein RRSWK_02714 [Rhodopirellula sp. SWK7]|nr:hypothetical protein RRSWK_02714 [Rhodopirellula sp. SWK7]
MNFSFEQNEKRLPGDSGRKRLGSFFFLDALISSDREVTYRQSLRAAFCQSSS